jgi:hypothetical protein
VRVHNINKKTSNIISLSKKISSREAIHRRNKQIPLSNPSWAFIPLMLLLIAVLVTFTSFISIHPSFASSAANQNQTIDPLPSWKNGAVKNNIIEFVQNITDPVNINYFISPENRIAVFDNDGTLWSEKPIPFQGFFSLDRVPEVIAKNPRLKDQFPFKEILAKNFTALKNMTEKDALNLMTVTHSNITQTKFDGLVHNWSQTAKHPQTKRLFIDMIYQPMLELLNYLKANQFKNFIVSGGGIDFMRDALSSVYDIPSDQIIGSSLKYQFVDKYNNNLTNATGNTDRSFIFRTSKGVVFDNTYEKPANIQLHIGKIPVVAVGNSDGDFQMLEYVSDNNPSGRSLELLVHHDDPEREFAYDNGAEKALAQAQDQNWKLVSMKDDFLNIFPAVNHTGLN